MFPRDDAKRDSWLKNIQCETWYPPKSAFICSDNFDEKFINRGGKLVKLTKDAVPTKLCINPLYNVNHDHNYCLGSKALLCNLVSVNTEGEGSREEEEPPPVLVRVLKT